MPKDHFQKQPTKHEQIESKIHRLEQNMNQLYRILGDINNRLIVLSRSKIGAEAFAIMFLEEEKNKEFMDEFNAILDEKIKARDKALADTDPLEAIKSTPGLTADSVDSAEME